SGCDSAGAIVAVIIDDHDAERPAIVLLQQRSHAARDAFGLVARRNDRGDRWPRVRDRADARIVSHAGAPIRAPRSDQVDPDHGTNDCNHDAHRHAFSACIDPPASTSITTLSSTRLPKHLTMWENSTTSAGPRVDMWRRAHTLPPSRM